MELKETRSIRCPFCGAPYRKIVPPNALQLKCDYCGAAFHTPPKIGVDIPQCTNHHERYATGVCNDCGQNFCSECLTSYSLKSQNERALLYLCPDCLRKRNLDKANALTFMGVIFLIFGVISAGFAGTGPPAALLFTVFFIVGGLLQLVYGFSRRSEVPSKPMLNVATSEREETPSPVDETSLEEAESLYDRLMSSYIEHWGVQTGMQLLDNEIRAYTWHGDTFAQAVRKVADRQKKRRR